VDNCAVPSKNPYSTQGRPLEITRRGSPKRENILRGSMKGWGPNQVFTWEGMDFSGTTYPNN